MQSNEKKRCGLWQLDTPTVDCLATIRPSQNNLNHQLPIFAFFHASES